MRANNSPIGRTVSLVEAINVFLQHEDNFHGMVATNVERKGSVLILRGEFF